MTQETWTAVDRYFTDLLVQPDAALEAALVASAQAGLPAISVTPPQGKLLHLLARMCGARRILEIGTLGGYSTIWLARALPPVGAGSSGGSAGTGRPQVVTLEYEPKHAEVARANFARAGLSDAIDVRLGPALETLPKLAAEREAGAGPFDLTFIDADKASTPDYFAWALKLSRPGSVIVVDNVVRDGKVIDAASEDASVRGIRRFNEMAAADKRVSATAIQCVGAKGYDGFVVALVMGT